MKTTFHKKLQALQEMQCKIAELAIRGTGMRIDYCVLKDGTYSVDVLFTKGGNLMRMFDRGDMGDNTHRWSVATIYSFDTPETIERTWNQIKDAYGKLLQETNTVG